MTASLHEIVGVPFVMVPIQGTDSPALVALREGLLKPRDLAVLFALLQSVTWQTGRIYLSTAELAAAVGVPSIEPVGQSLTRLKRAGFIARGQEANNKRRAFWCINPWVIGSSGGKNRRCAQEWQFEAAAGEGCQVPKRSRTLEREPLTCEKCGGSFTSRRSTTRFCSARCRGAAAAARARLQAAAQEARTASAVASVRAIATGVRAGAAAPVQAACPGPLSSPPAPALAAAAGDRPLVSVQAIADAVLAASRRQAERTPRGRLPEA